MKSSMEKLLGYKDMYKGEHGVILTCGPSLNHYDDDTLCAKLKGKVVLAVKQAYHRVPHLVDFHFWNCCNLPIPDAHGVHYRYLQGRRQHAIASSNFNLNAKWTPVQNKFIDLFFKIPNPSVDGMNFVTKSLDFDKWTIQKAGLHRPCGPGIMYETVFYMAHWLGFKTITIMGWDLNQDPNNQYPHFYSDKVFNPGYILPWEVQVTRAAATPLYHWFNKEGVELQLDSPYSAIPTIPRVQL